MDGNEIHFLQPLYFVLILLVPIFIFLYIKKQKKSLNFLFFEELKKSFGGNSFFYYLQIILIPLIIIYFAIILSNPNISNKSEKINKNGIDIVIALDVSTSMDATDLLPSRIESAKEMLIDFIDFQKTNRLGLVLFAGKPFMSIPLTFDYNIITETISNTTTASINQTYTQLSGTAIGDAIIMSETLFGEESFLTEKREKVIVLITDGDANVGVEPSIAAQHAKEKNIKIYTIGIGSLDGGEYSYYVGPFLQTQIIPPLNGLALEKIAEITNGEFFRATDDNTLENIFNYLEKLEKNDIEIETKKQYSTYYEPFIFTLLFLVLVYVLLIFWKPDI